MRISDWSSDVCSSDLGVVSRRHRAGVGDLGARRRGTDRVGHATGSGIALAQVRSVDLGVIAEAQQVVSQQPLEVGPRLFALVGTVDRKSVESGKRVSVRVDRGGRGIVKKKTN